MSTHYFNSAKNVSHLLWKRTNTEQNLPSTTAKMHAFRDFPNLPIVMIFYLIVDLPKNSRVNNGID